MSEEPKPAEKCCEGRLDELAACVEKCAQREPLKCALIAFLSGLVLTVLPVGALVGGIVRLALALARPVLVVLGAMKVFEEIERRRRP